MSYQNIIVETKAASASSGSTGRRRSTRSTSRSRTSCRDAIDTFEADDAIGCMLITGSEKAFAAGADIKEMADKTFIEAFIGNFTGNWDRAARARKPIVAAVAGFALGGGCELAMSATSSSPPTPPNSASPRSSSASSRASAARSGSPARSARPRRWR